MPLVVAAATRESKTVTPVLERVPLEIDTVTTTFWQVHWLWNKYM